MTDLQIFNSPEFGAIRTIEKDGEPWFVGKDVAAALGYEKPTDAVRKHVDVEDRGISKMETPSGAQETTIINESGLYSLVLSSKLPTAKKFKRWVTSEVIPSIRKHGAYMTPETLEAAILNPDTMIKLIREENLKMQPTTEILATAKQLEVKEKELIGFLLEKKYIYRDKKGKLQPYADKNNGLFEVKECFNEKTKWSGTQTLVTPKGRETFRLLWMREVR